MTQTFEQLLELNPLHLPATPSWWPIAWGWLSLAGALFAGLLVVWLFINWRIKRQIPRKTALRLLHSTRTQVTPSEAIELLRQAALCYFPRQDIAYLTGPEWYQFLDQQLGRPLFTPNETQWQQALYKKNPTSDSQNSGRDRLVEDCYVWVSEALPPRKRR
jgi:hypothetical protein